jgi:hypothetical protein
MSTIEILQECHYLLARINAANVDAKDDDTFTRLSCLQLHVRELCRRGSDDVTIPSVAPAECTAHTEARG